MVRAKYTKLAFNLESLNKEYVDLCSDEERSEFLRGLVRGSNGCIPCPGSGAFMSGQSFGRNMHSEMISKRQKCAVAGGKRGTNG